MLYLHTPSALSHGRPRLSPRGARLLRRTREHLRRHPHLLNLTSWGSCLAWHLEHVACTSWRARLAHWWAGPTHDGRRAARLLGFADDRPCHALFLVYDVTEARDVRRLIARIDLFLAAHGYRLQEPDVDDLGEHVDDDPYLDDDADLTSDDGWGLDDEDEDDALDVHPVTP